MKIRLVEITMDNFEACIRLQVQASQKGFVASNVYSLAEAYADKVSKPYGIYAKDVMVGFIMYDYDPEKATGFISRLMIDGRFQKNGYGQEALQVVMEEFRSIPECKVIQLSHNEDNANAARLYEKLGFAETGERTSNGEVIRRVTI